MSKLEDFLKSKGILEPVEQVGHFFMGFGAGLLNLGLLLWWREWVKQWPPGEPFTIGISDPPQYVTQLDRVADTAKDLKYMEIGRTVVWFFVVGLAFWAGKAWG